MKQYLDLCKHIIDNGEIVYNKRTSKNVYTIINYDLEYDVENNVCPVLTTRKINWKSAIAEIIGHIRGYTSAEAYRKLGTSVWLKNANENIDWLKNPYRFGRDDMGFIYGAVAKNYPVYLPAYLPIDFPVNNDYITHGIDLIKQVYTDLRNKIDNRSEIITFYHPGAFHLACLKPCLFQYQYSILGDKLYLNAYQRSCDVPLGLAFNMIQVFFMLAIMAKITGLKPGKAYHKIVNAHIYEDQFELTKEQIKREPFDSPQLIINDKINTLEDLNTWVTLDDFNLVNYNHHDPIKYPFSV